MSAASFARRDFITKAAKVSIAISFWNIVPASKSIASIDHDVTIDLTQSANTALNTIGGSLYVSIPADNVRVIVVRLSETEVSAFSSVCTHSGCQVNLPTGGVAVCPCHNSRFSSRGAVVSGPAMTDLTKYRALLEGDFIYVDRIPVSVSYNATGLEKNAEISLENNSSRIQVTWNDIRSRPLSWKLFDSAGKELLENSVSQSSHFYISGRFLPRGKYILVITTSGAQTATFGVTLF